METDAQFYQCCVGLLNNSHEINIGSVVSKNGHVNQKKWNKIIKECDLEYQAVVQAVVEAVSMYL